MGTMTADFGGDVAIVTGSSGGMGRAVVARLRAARARAVVMGDVDEAGGRETERLIEEAGGRAVFLATDVSDDRAVAALVDFRRRRNSAGSTAPSTPPRSRTRRPLSTSAPTTTSIACSR